MEKIYGKFFKEQFDEAGNLKSVSIECRENFNFSYDILDEIAKNYPDDLALIWCDDYNNEKKITFKQMSEMSNRVANFFISQGIKYGDFVLVILKRNFEYWYVLNALCKIGAVAIPATHMLSGMDLKYRIEFANVKSVVFTNQQDLPQRISSVLDEIEDDVKLFSVRGSVLGSIDIFKEIEKYSPILERVKTNVNDKMLCYFTSGTTGLPKLVQHSFSYPLAHIVTAKYWQKAFKRGIHLTVSDTGWGKAAWGKIYGQWAVGATIMVYDYDKFYPDKMLDVMEKYNVTTFCAPPTVYRFFIKGGVIKHNISSVKHVTTAGEALNPEIIRQFKKITGLEIMAGFGQTETTALLFNDVETKDKVGSIGKISPIYDVVLVDEKGNEVGANEEGEICIKLKGNEPIVGLFIGYYNDDKANEYALRGGLYHTGDVAFRDEDGFFWYVGRKDDIIKSSGYRIGPFEVESVLIEHPAVLECGVVGVFDEVRGQLVKANVVLTKNFKPSEELSKELQDFVKKKTAPYKYPRIIEFMDALPKTISGKIKRNVLRNEHNEFFFKETLHIKNKK